MKIKMKKIKWLQKTAIVLAGIGAINWGLVRLGWNAVELFNFINWLPTIIYYLIGLSGVYTLSWFYRETIK